MNQIKLKTTINPPTQCLQIGNSAFAEFLPSLSGAHCVGGFPILGGNMKEHSKPTYDPTEIEVQSQEWLRRSIQKDAIRFEQIVEETRQRLGLGVSNV